MFSYCTLREVLRRAGQVDAVRALERAVEIEAAALRAFRGTHNTPKLKQLSEEEARRYYLEDIQDKLADPTLTAGQVLYHRRFATAWAIARVVLDNGLKEALDNDNGDNNNAA